MARVRDPTAPFCPAVKLAWLAIEFQLLTGSVAANAEPVDSKVKVAIAASQVIGFHLGFCIILSSLERRLTMATLCVASCEAVAGFPRGTMLVLDFNRS